MSSTIREEAQLERGSAEPRRGYVISKYHFAQNNLRSRLPSPGGRH
jgi:hypothetical protein